MILCKYEGDFLKIIVGLGNPGKEYVNTRHNLGFLVINELSKELDIKVDRDRLSGALGIGKFQNDKIILVKPLTYMNLSGDCVQKVMKYYKATLDDLIVIYDDIDIDIGKIRIKPSGSPGTHNGMKDITNKLASKDFVRVRVGSGKPNNNQDLADYVLSEFSKKDKDSVEKAIKDAKDAVIMILKDGVEKAMNQYN